MLDLFSGIGGFSLGLERTNGFETVAFCEIEPYPQAVLRKHWPNVPIYDDIRTLTAERLKSDGISVDVITGGFPCQDLSVAGKQAGIDGERSGLWKELCRIISEVRPQYAIVENVPTLLSGDRGRWFGRVLGDLAEIGYDTEWETFSSRPFGTNHKRIRTWVIAYPASKRLERRVFTKEAWKIRPKVAACDWWTAENRILRKSDRATDWIPKSKIIGNGQVVQVVEWIGKRIMEFEIMKEKV